MSYYEEEYDCDDDCNCPKCEDDKGVNDTPLDPVKALIRDAIKLPNLPEELIDNAIESITSGVNRLILSHATNIINSIIQKQVKEALASELIELSRQYMRIEFAKVLSDDLLLPRKESWEYKKVPIKDFIRAELEEAKKEIKNKQGDFIKECVDSLVGKELGEMAKQCVSEYKVSTMHEIRKEAGKKLTQSIAVAMSGDKDLMKLLEIAK